MRKDVHRCRSESEYLRIGLYMREYSGGVALVNTSLAGGVNLGTSYTAALPPGSTYRDVYGNPISLSRHGAADGGLILLKTTGAVCSNGSSAQAVSAFSGTPQSTQAGTAFANALKAKVTDSLSNPLAGIR
jgi:hypothetical protein